MPDTQTSSLRTETKMYADHTRVDHNRLRLKNRSTVQHDSTPANPSTTGPGKLLRRLASLYTKSKLGSWLPLIFSNEADIWKGFLHHPGRRKRINDTNSHNKKQIAAKKAIAVLTGAFVFAWMITASGRKSKR